MLFNVLGDNTQTPTAQILSEVAFFLFFSLFINPVIWECLGKIGCQHPENIVQFISFDNSGLSLGLPCAIASVCLRTWWRGADLGLCCAGHGPKGRSVRPVG